jgi:hypothetical protein
MCTCWRVTAASVLSLMLCGIVLGTAAACSTKFMVLFLCTCWLVTATSVLFLMLCALCLAQQRPAQQSWCAVCALAGW